MIVASVIDISIGGSFNNNGAASSAQVFYTENDAVIWCQVMSESMDVLGTQFYALTVMINTDTEVKRWWFNGTERTG